ncbi:MAG: hypothetical protein M5U26_00915 [Planctomycetota bacterium]|nr:hypothetical protein [Planctomycetota bacterium]
MSPSTPVLFLFASDPETGPAAPEVLARLGETGAARFAEARLLDLLHRFAALDEPRPLRRVLCFEPLPRKPAFRALLQREGLDEAWDLLPQAEGDPGHKRACACQYALLKGLGASAYFDAERLELQDAEIRQAFAGAAAGRARLLRGTGGACALVALPAGAEPRVFEQIRWGTPHAAEDQRIQLLRRNLEVGVSSLHAGAGLEALRARLEADPERAPRTLAVLKAALNP